MDDPIRIGICGAGSIVGTHLGAIRRVKGLLPVAVSSRTLKTAKKTAHEWKVGKAYSDHMKLIESPGLDVVIVATPNYQHFELAMAALDADKHVMVEKPLAISFDQGKKMVAFAAKKGLHLLYAENLPLAPKFVRLTEMAREGRFGDIYMVRQIERHAGPYSPWFFQKELAGGGALMDLGCHSISVVLDIMKGKTAESVSAVQQSYQSRGDVEDFMILTIHFEGGAVGVVECNWCHQGGMDSVTEVFGSKGNGYADLMKGSGLTVYTAQKPKTLWKSDLGWHNPPFDPLYEFGYISQFESMAAAIRGKADAPQTGRDGLDVLRIMEAAYRSAAQSGKAIRVKKG